MDGGWRRIEPETQAWVNTLTVVLLFLTIYYFIAGIPEFHHADTGGAEVSTDAVDPVHRFAWVGLFAAAIPIAWMRWRQVFGLLAGAWPLLLLYVYFACSITWALDPDVAFRRLFLGTLQLLLVAALVSGLRRAATLHILIAGACILGAGLDVLSMAVPSLSFADDGFVGLQSQKNQAGLLMMYGCLAAGTAYFLVESRLLRAGLAASVVMMFGLLILTRSTTSQSVVLMTPFLMPAILIVSRFGGAGIWAVVMAIVAVLAAGAFGYIAWCAVTGADPWLPMRGVTFTMRTDIWEFVLEEIGKRPWFGVGYSSFWAINPAIQPSLKSDMWFGTYAIINEAHNGYLDLLVSLGVVGLVLGLFVVFRAIGQAGRAIVGTEPIGTAWVTGQMAHPTAVFHLALLLGLLVHNFTESNLFTSNTGLVVAFLVTALDLQKWRNAKWAPAPVRYPNPAAARPPRPQAPQAG